MQRRREPPGRQTLDRASVVAGDLAAGLLGEGLEFIEARGHAELEPLKDLVEMDRPMHACLFVVDVQLGEVVGQERYGLVMIFVPQKGEDPTKRVARVEVVGTAVGPPVPQ